ncbi:UNVERIFIED_ORG: protein kinase [Shinella sp. XGS7]|nr:serine/threonine-protein kinase [Shinella sp. XGS7]
MQAIDPLSSGPHGSSGLPTDPKARWQRLSPLLDELLDMEATARAARLAALRDLEPELAAELERLLAQDAELEAQGFLAQPALPPTLSAVVALPGQTVGAYRLEREIGHGGMGSVWLARRTDGRFEGQVAIKFLTTGLLGQGDAARFAREGQILARLTHPHIARLIDAGVAQDGLQPYLVLEYVEDGLPIDRFCESRQLDTAQRITLFLDVLAAVAHAHNRLILHRDLKPGNILVDRQGQVKLLDFGIAKLLGDSTQPAEATELTRQAGRAFTPQFAAPEQVQGGEVSTATDVYALGVLLYLLLSGGKHPTAGATRVEAQALDRLRAVVEEEPKRLSDQLRIQGDARRARELRGDLDTICAKALKKRPSERYENAAALAEDLRRWLQHEPIAARPDSRSYRLAKFLRRHYLGVAAGSVAVLGLSTGIGLALWKAHEAQTQRTQAEGLIEFMLGDLRKKLEPVGRLDVLDAVGDKALGYYNAQDLARSDADSLGRRARALHLMGEIAEKRGRLDEAYRMFREATASTGELMARAPGDGQRLFDHAQSTYWVGFVAWRRGQQQEALTQFQRYLALANELGKVQPQRHEWRSERAYALNNLGVLKLEMGQADAALSDLAQSRERWLELVAQDPDLNLDLASTLGWMARASLDRADYASALGLERERMAVIAAMPASGDSRDLQGQAATSQHQISQIQLYLGRPLEALESAKAAAAALEPLVAQDPDNLDGLHQLSAVRLGMGEILAHLGRPAELGTLMQGLRRDVDLLRQADASKLDWQCGLAGRVLLLQAQTGRLDIEAARRHLRQMQDLAQGGAVFSHEHQRINAALEIQLGRQLSAQAPEQARQYWITAAERLRPAGNDPRALALLGQAQFLLGDTEEARRAAEKLGASAYLHPDRQVLQRLLGAPEKPATPQKASHIMSSKT